MSTALRRLRVERDLLAEEAEWWGAVRPASDWSRSQVSSREDRLVVVEEELRRLEARVRAREAEEAG